MLIYDSIEIIIIIIIVIYSFLGNSPASKF